MKYLVAAALLVIFAASCRDKTYCWQCTSINMSYPGKVIDTMVTTECDKTEDQISVDEKVNSGWWHYPDGDSFHVSEDCHK